MKITVFQMNGKISIKFENHLIEHIMKLRDGSPLNELENIKTALTPEVLSNIERAIEAQSKIRGQLETQLIENELDEFDEII